MTSAAASGGLPSELEFKSALTYTTVRDFAYPELHPMHYGTAIPKDPMDQSESEEEDENGWEVRQKFADLDAEAEQFDEDEIYCQAMALFDFVPENDNEISLVEGQVVFVIYRHGQGWLLAENLEDGSTGLVPEEYVQLLPEEDEPQDVAAGLGELSLDG